jgi:site-specific DNA recombinase
MTGTAAIYCRISKDSTRQGLGVDRQEEECRDLAQREGLSVVEVFTDNDISASSNSRKPRPRFDAMVAGVREGRFTHVVSHSNTRLTRRMRELEDLIDLAKETGVQYFTVVSGNDNLATATGKQMARIKGSIAAGEADLTGERVRAAAKQRAELGKPKHSRYRTFGYDAEFKAIPAEAAVIRDAFERVVRGESVSSIAMMWRANDVSMGNGKDVHYSTVKNVVRRHLYAALSTYKGEVVGRSIAEPIVSEALFYAAQDVLDKKRNPRSGKNARRYLLAGLIQCGVCGHVLYGSHTYTNKSGNSRHSYICKPHMQGCGKVSVMGHHVDELVLTMVKRRMTMTDAIEVPESIDYQSQIDALEEQMQVARADVRAGRLTFLDIRETLIHLSQQKTALEALAVTQEDVEANFVPNRTWNQFKTASLSEQMATVGAVIQGVVVVPATSKTWDASRVTIYTKRGNAVPGTSIKSDVGDMRRIVAGFRDVPVNPTKLSKPIKGPDGKFAGSNKADA